MSIKIIAIVGAIVAILFIATKCCIYTSIVAFVVMSSVGYTPIYCMAESGDCYHAYIRIDNTTIEPSTLNLYRSPVIDYTNPVYTYGTTQDFTSSVDMWSPIH